jgi:L-fuculose-phosphate aldolase
MSEEAAAGLVRLGRRGVQAGLVVASGGNLAARLPSDPNRVMVTPAGWALDELDPAALPVVALDGSVVGSSDTAEPTSELALHLAAFRARPDVMVSVHLHPPMATLLHALDIDIRLITTDHAYYVRRIGGVPYLPPGSTALADAAAAELGRSDVVLLGRHGCLVVADAFDLAFSRAANLEAAAVATYRALAIGATPPPPPPNSTLS